MPDDGRRALGIMRVAGLFAGIGGFELGFERAGHRAILLCESDEHAMHVLRHQWPDVRLHGDIATLQKLPAETEIVSAGFACQNLSMAGDKQGIKGRKSAVVGRLFELLDRHPIRWIVIENVYFMLHLQRGAAIAYILEQFEQRGYRWAYRVVNSRAFGLPQRRRRVFIVASRSLDPRDVLLADDAGTMKWPDIDMAHPIGFYWTEGRAGHGLTADAIPPLKACSTKAIPCPPAVLLPSGRVVIPTVQAAERFQGLTGRWTSALRGKSARYRWRLLGNAVTVPVAEWIGRRLAEPGSYEIPKPMPVPILSAAKRMCERSGWTLTKLQILRMSFLANMFYLGETNEPLVDGNFQAWDLGPIHPILYQAVKRYGANPVPPEAFGYVEKVPDDHPSARFLDAAVDELPHNRLAGLVHWKHGAWARNYGPYGHGEPIPNRHILDEYRSRQELDRTSQS